MASKNLYSKTTIDRLAGVIGESFAQKSEIAEYTLTRQAEAENGYLATYQLFKGSDAVGDKINIPKDFLVKSGEVKTVATANTPYDGAVVGDKYIDFVINVKAGSATDEHIYLPVNELVDAYNAGNGLELGANNTFAVKVDSSNANGLTVGASGLGIGVATDAAAGAMSAADHTKLSGVSAGATKVEVPATPDGTITVDGQSKTVYTLPDDVLTEDDISDYSEAELKALLGITAAE